LSSTIFFAAGGRRQRMFGRREQATRRKREGATGMAGKRKRERTEALDASRRTFCRSAALGLAALASPALAQERWWETFPGFSRSEPRLAANDERRQPELNDLRPDRVPLRSQELIDALDEAIRRYQHIVSNGGWPMIPGTRPIRPEDNDERVALLYRRLASSGEWRARPSQTLFGIDYSDGMEAAVRRFQENHGRRVTGRADRSTLQALNTPAQARLAQLRINQQRLRDLMNQRLDDRYVLVNAAAFQLEAVERHEVALRHRVIVGKPNRQTPTVRATIRALNFFPYWRVPESVATLDLIPRLVKEPGYLQEEGIRVLTGSYNGPEIDPTAIDWRQVDAGKLRFRQDPGARNALGLVRIDMPNEHGVYMHDTPLKTLFKQRSRAFSAGCVRVEDVFTLVEWIAKYETGWDQPGRAQDVIATGQALDLTLMRPVPVHFTYITAWAELDGRIVFRPDIYGRDGVRELLASADRDPDDDPPPRWTLAP
jgi:murein L,D-transpeptidase YcbB/YkuD